MMNKTEIESRCTIERKLSDHLRLRETCHLLDVVMHRVLTENARLNDKL